MNATLSQPASAATRAIVCGDARSASVSISRDLLSRRPNADVEAHLRRDLALREPAAPQPRERIYLVGATALH